MSSSAAARNRSSPMTVEQIHREMGPVYFRKAFRMTYESFCNLHDQLQGRIIHLRATRNTVPESVSSSTTTTTTTSTTTPPDESTPTKICLAIALRCLAGGEPCDLMSIYALSYSAVMSSWVVVVQAMNETKDFNCLSPTESKALKRMVQRYNEATSHLG
jgi:hypothetical protein